MLMDVIQLEEAYYGRRPDSSNPGQLVNFRAGGHCGSPLGGTFTETHVLAITQAVCDYRSAHGTDGPLYMGRDTHALSGPAQDTALEVLAANGIDTIIQRGYGVTPAPVISRAILAHNRNRRKYLADGIVITPHNQPEDGGFRYNHTHGGPADADVTRWIEKRANELLRGRNAGVKRLAFAKAIQAPTTHEEDLVMPYVRDLANVVDMEAIRSAGLKLAVDPLGGVARSYWERINSTYRLDIGPDADRYGVVTPSAGLLDPNHYMAVAVHYLLTHRPNWELKAAVGKTLMSSCIIDRIVHKLGRRLCEVPVGFKWFTRGLFDGSYCFGGEESTGASFLRRDGTVWTTDKDGVILSLLAAEITAQTGREPGERYRELTAEFGAPCCSRLDSPATPGQKARLERLSPDDVRESSLAGETIAAKVTRAPGNGAPIGGLKIVTASGWFAARSADTENSYKIYAESFRNEAHLDAIITQGREIVARALASGEAQR
jgi:phosphoglucomutase